MTSDDRSHTPLASCPGEALSASLDYELDPAEAQQVEQHVDECADCRAELAGLERVRRILRELPSESAPSGYVDKLVGDRHRANRRGVALAGVAASLLVVLSLAVAEPLDRSDTTTAVDARGNGDDMVRLETLDTAADGGDGEDESEMSVFDRAHAAGRELLDFLGG
jgi:anti-sigma factor RsiW